MIVEALAIVLGMVGAFGFVVYCIADLITMLKTGHHRDDVR